MKAYLKNKAVAKGRNDGRWHNKGRDWATDKELYERLNKEFNFTLDVCASEWNKKNDIYFSEKDNGLIQDWHKHICFMNPPYGKELGKWVEKAYNESRKGAVVVCLIPASTDLDWWHEFVLKGEIRYLRGRPRFYTKEGKWQNTFSPSVIVIFRKEKEVVKGV